MFTALVVKLLWAIQQVETDNDHKSQNEESKNSVRPKIWQPSLCWFIIRYIKKLLQGEG